MAGSQAEAPEGGPAGNPAPGLVHIPTSATLAGEQQPPEDVQVWLHEERARRAGRAIVTTARLISEGIRGRVRPIMVTLTYGAGEWEPRHVTEFISRVRQWALRQGTRAMAYVWAAELQGRGAVHYHVLLWLPARLTLPKPDKRGWWSHGMTRVERARNAVGYIAKYASKVATKLGEFPRGLRMHGSGGLDAACRVVRRWWMSPRWVRDGFELGADVRKHRGGGYVHFGTGEVLLSPYQFVGRSKHGAFGYCIHLRRRSV